MTSNKARNIVVSLLVCLLFLTANVVMSAEKKVVGFKKWKEFKENIKKDKSVARYYTFEEGAEVSNEVNSEGKLVYKDLNAKQGEPLSEELSFVDGRWTEKKAVRLENCTFAGDSFNIKDNTFTMELWTKMNGQGSILGNGKDYNSNIIILPGSWRVIIYNSPSDTGSGAIVFQIFGEKNEPMRLQMQTIPIEKGVWHHLVFTGDAETIKIYVDGSVKASKKYSGGFIEQSREMWIGWSTWGTGSEILDIDEIILYNRAITEKEVKEHYDVIK